MEGDQLKQYLSSFKPQSRKCPYGTTLFLDEKEVVASIAEPMPTGDIIIPCNEVFVQNWSSTATDYWLIGYSKDVNQLPLYKHHGDGALSSKHTLNFGDVGIKPGTLFYMKAVVMASVDCDKRFSIVYDGDG